MYSILDMYLPISEHNVGCSNGSEIPAMTEIITIETDVSDTNA